MSMRVESDVITAVDLDVVRDQAFEREPRAAWMERAGVASQQLDALQVDGKKEAIREWTSRTRGKPYLYALHKHQVSQRPYHDVIADIGQLPDSIGALYLHFPYCTKHCMHCHYYKTTNGSAEDWTAFPQFMLRELQLVLRAYGRDRLVADTLHFGGGTPSLIAREPWKQMMSGLSELVDLSRTREIAVEVDPADLNADQLDYWHMAGVNRISLGVQSFHDEVLRRMNRQHTGAQGIAAVKMIQQSDIENLNVDLMYGMPGRELATWQWDLDVIARLRPQSVTCYATRPDPQNQLDVAKAFPPESERLIAHQMAIGQLMELGYLQYSPNQFIQDYSGACLAKNNRNRCQDVLGIGPHAHSIFQGWFYENMLGVEKYIQSIREGNLCPIRGERIVGAEAKRRFVQFGIKLSGLCKPLLDNGVSRSDYAAAFDSDLFVDFADVLQLLREARLIDHRREDAVALTHAGVLLSDDVVKMFAAMSS
jgi:oxygen-independent coproporphyrinogen-3 oxidase